MSSSSTAPARLPGQGPRRIRRHAISGTPGTTAIAGHAHLPRALQGHRRAAPPRRVVLQMPYAASSTTSRQTRIVDRRGLGHRPRAPTARAVGLHPLYSAAQRIVVFARLAGAERAERRAYRYLRMLRPPDSPDAVTFDSCRGMRMEELKLRIQRATTSRRSGGCGGHAPPRHQSQAVCNPSCLRDTRTSTRLRGSVGDGADPGQRCADSAASRSAGRSTRTARSPRPRGGKLPGRHAELRRDVRDTAGQRSASRSISSETPLARAT